MYAQITNILLIINIFEWKYLRTCFHKNISTLYFIIIIIYFREILSENNETEITELDTEKFVPIAVECLAILIKLNDTIEVSSRIYFKMY